MLGKCSLIPGKILEVECSSISASGNSCVPTNAKFRKTLQSEKLVRNEKHYRKDERLVQYEYFENLHQTSIKRYFEGRYRDDVE